MKKVYVVVDVRGAVIGVYRSYKSAECARYARAEAMGLAGALDTRVFIQCKYLED